jgi:hypothetical protein
MDGHAVQGLGLADDAEDEVGELGRGLEQEPALQGAGGALDEGLLGDETQGTWRTYVSAWEWESCMRFPSPPEDCGTSPAALAAGKQC